MTRPDLGGQYWRALERRRTFASVAGAVLVLAVLAGSLASSAVLEPPQSPDMWPRRTVIGGIDVGEAPSQPASRPVEPAEGGGAAPAPDEGEAEVAPVRAPKVAYRHDGRVWVADESGAGERAVAASADGCLALSPDGETLAVVDSVRGVLVLVSASEGTSVTVGPALAVRPSWAPDSSWLAYAAPGPSVRQVGRDGSGDLELFKGTYPAVSSDGSLVAGAGGDDGDEVLVWRAGSLARLRAAAPVTGVACDGATLYYGTAVPVSGTAALHAVALDGSVDRALVPAPATPLVSGFRELALSPDGRWLAYAEYGDDEYSRLFAVPTSGGSPSALSLRRDCYLLGWSADGSRLLVVEGNAYQGEPTALIEVRPDGSGRRLLREGVSR